MIKKLQHRFILITLACVSFIFILILLALNLFMTISSQRQGYNILSDYANRKKMYENSELPEDKPAFPPFSPEGDLPEDMNDVSKGNNNIPKNELPPMNRHDWFNDVRIFSVYYDEQGEVSKVFVGSNPDLTEEALQALADKASVQKKEKGSISGYLYLVDTQESGTRIYFLDYAPERDMSNQLFRVCLWIGLAGILLILIPFRFLSRWVSMPVQLAFEQQKQFIADASHELKTPLTIITTNAEVLDTSLPDNKWIQHILEQSNRMKQLINSLLALAKLDSLQEKQDFITFDLSKAVKNSSLSFECMAYEYHKQYTMDITDGITLNGIEGSIKQLITILLDNAFKYSDENGEILIRLSLHGDKKILLVRNTGKGISAQDQKHIFERFYRSDASRSRESGGYGLGLSIAQSIMETHKGQLKVESDGETYTSFTAIFP